MLIRHNDVFIRMMEAGQPSSGRQNISTWTRSSCFCPKGLTLALGTRLAKTSVQSVSNILNFKTSKIIQLLPHVMLPSRKRTYASTGQHFLAVRILRSSSSMPIVTCRLPTFTETLRCTSLPGRTVLTASREFKPPEGTSF